MAETFDVQRYTQSPYGPAEAPKAFEVLSESSAAELAVLGAHIGRTSSWLAKVLVSATHKDARATAFLSTWAYERYWMGASLIKLSGKEKETSAAREARPTGALWAAVRANLLGRLASTMQGAERAADSLIVGELVQEISRALPAASAQVLRPISGALGSHLAFFAEFARPGQSSTLERWLVRRHLRAQTWPLGFNSVDSQIMLAKLSPALRVKMVQDLEVRLGLTKLRLRGLQA